MSITRRQLLKSSALATAGLPAAARMVHAGRACRNVMRLAVAGYGGQGHSGLKRLTSHPDVQLVAACDVDRRFEPRLEEFGENISRFQDYRKMLSQRGDGIDGVLIATPDHMHAPIAQLALQQDHHVYLQKPLAQDIGECRMLTTLAADRGQATQMGIQIHGHEFYRSAASWIRQGVVGRIGEVHSWSGKGWGGEPSPRPPSAVPAELDWDLYLGVAPYREYVDGWYHRNNWRKWFAFGTGTQGDMGCHILDPVFSALSLKHPTWVQSRGPAPLAENFALDSHVQHEFPGTEFTTDPLPLTWYNGDMRPRQLDCLPDGLELPGQGSVFVGQRGILLLPHVGPPRVFPAAGQQLQDLPPPVPAVNHYHQWVDAALGRIDAADADFAYSGPLTETVLMGTVVNRWPDRRFVWDADRCRFAGNDPVDEQANALLFPPWRTDW